MRITVIGCGDAFGSGGRFNTCFLVESDQLTFLIDCGASSMVALKQHGVDLNSIDAVFLSHLHGDHFGALPFFILDARYVHGRKRDLLIAGPEGTQERLLAAQEVFFPGMSAIEDKFALTFAEIPVAQPKQVAGVTVTAREMRHPSGAPSLALRLELDGKVLTYSGDTEWTENLIKAARGADLFICECYAPGAPPPMHMSYPQIVEHYGDFAAKKIVLTHMGEAMLASLDQVDNSRFIPAEDGMVIEI